MPDRTRRRLLASVGALAAPLTGCLGTDSSADQSPSPTSSPRTDTRTRSPTDTQRPTAEGVAWTRDLDSTVEHAPAVVEDTVVVGATDGMYGLTRANGRVRWTAPAEQPTASSPVVHDGLAYVVSGTHELGASHIVRAIDVDDGTVRWTFAPDEWWLEVLAVYEGLVYVGTSDDAISDTGQTLYALAATTGDTRWTAEIGDPSGGVASGETVAVGCHTRVYGYGTDGTARWEQDGPEYQFKTLAATPDTVAYVGSGDTPSDTTLYALAASDGRERWTVDGWFLTSTRLHDGVLYAGGEHVAAFDPATGDRRWRTEDGGSIYDAPVVDGRIFASTAEAVFAYRTDTGKRAWRFAPDAYLPDASAVLEDTTIVHASHSDDDRNRLVIGVNADDGTERWRVTAEKRLTTPVPGVDRAFAGSEIGIVYAFES